MKKEPSVLFYIITSIVGSVGNIAAFAFHLYTTYLAYQASLFDAMLTLSTPVISEMYWFFRIWCGTGEFINRYSVMFFITGALVLLSITFISLRLKREIERNL